MKRWKVRCECGNSLIAKQGDTPKKRCTNCGANIEVGNPPPHMDHNYDLLISCEDYEANTQKWIDQRRKHFSELYEALGLTSEGCEWQKVHEEMLDHISKLKVKAARWDAFQAAKNDHEEHKTAHEELRALRDETYTRCQHVFVMMGGEALCVKCGIFSELPVIHRPSATAILVLDNPRETGPGLKAQGGEYTEPGYVVIHCDNGSDD